MTLRHLYLLFCLYDAYSTIAVLRLVVEAQATLVKFLQKVTGLLLEGLTENEPRSSIKWQQFLAGSLKTTGETTTWSTFVYRPFSAPPQFKVDNLLAMAQARMNSTGDHLWLLQTEPSYLKRHIRKLKQAQLVDLGNDKEATTAFIYGELAYDIKLHSFWREAVEEFENLQTVYRRYRDSIAPGSPLPPKVERALGSIELVLVNTILSRSKRLQAMITQRPGFRHMYHFEGIIRPTPEQPTWGFGTSLKSKYTGEAGKTVSFREERLWFLVNNLLGGPDNEQRYRYDMLLDMLDEHLASSSMAERGRLDEVLYDIVSDFVTLIELLWAVRTHMPLYASRTVKECRQTEHSIFWRKGNRRDQIPQINTTRSFRALRKFQNTVPPSGPRNQQWLNQFEALHGSSQEFWKSISADSQQILRALLPTVDYEQHRGYLCTWKDGQYLARLEAKRQQILADMQKPKIPESEDVFLPLLTSAADEKIDVAKSKTKVKTRDESSQTEDDVQAEDHVLEQDDLPPVPTINVSKRSYATFRYMYPETPEERQKSIYWNTFVDSMMDAGFAARNGGGSIVTFENLAGGGKIIFHRPHPEPRIDPIMLQSMGNRLNRWFGWGRETFVVEKK